MNRLRAAYVDLDPGVAPYLMASPYDDRAGSRQTYFFLAKRGSFSQVGGSSMMFIIAVNAALNGLLASAIAGILSAPTPVVVIVGAFLGVAFFAVSMVYGARGYFGVWRTHTPLRPSDADQGR
jgi:hypothetical protein